MYITKQWDCKPFFNGTPCHRRKRLSHGTLGSHGSPGRARENSPAPRASHPPKCASRSSRSCAPFPRPLGTAPAFWPSRCHAESLAILSRRFGRAQERKWSATVSAGPVAAASPVKRPGNNSDVLPIQACCGWASPPPRSMRCQGDCVLQPNIGAIGPPEASVMMR